MTHTAETEPESIRELYLAGLKRRCVRNDGAVMGPNTELILINMLCD